MNLPLCEGPWDMCLWRRELCLCVSMRAVCLCEGMCLWGCCMRGAGVARGLSDTVWVCLRRHMPPFYLFYLFFSLSPLCLPWMYILFFLLLPSPGLLIPLSASASPSILHSNNNSIGEQTRAFPLRDMAVEITDTWFRSSKGAASLNRGRPLISEEVGERHG